MLFDHVLAAGVCCFKMLRAERTGSQSFGFEGYRASASLASAGLGGKNAGIRI